MLCFEIMLLSKFERRTKKFSMYDWVPIQIYCSICCADGSTEEIDQKRCTIFMGTRGEAGFEKLKASITSEDTFFDPLKPIVVQTEASFQEGLSAGLFQRTGKGLLPVQ